MIFHAPHLLLSLRWAVPAVTIFGNVTTTVAMLFMTQLLTLPLPERFAWSINRFLVSKYMSLIGFFYETWSGVEFCYYGDPYPLKPENVLYLSNHQCTVDWVIADTLCVKQSGYGGRVRYTMKSTLKYVPIFGWQLGYRGSIYLKRNRTQDETWLIEKLTWFQRKNIPVWMVLFPEGTRFNPGRVKQIERSWSYAETQGLERFHNVLVPHTKGFEITIDSLRQYLDAVYDITIIYEGREGKRVRSSSLPTLFSFYSGKCRKVHVHFRRVPICDIPTDKEGQKQWMYDSFRRKEKLIEGFYETGQISSPQYSLPLPLSYTLLPTVFYLTMFGVVMATKQGPKWWLGSTVLFTILGLIIARRY